MTMLRPSHVLLFIAAFTIPASALAEDLSLSDARERAATVHVEVQIAEERLASAALLIDQARAIWIPSVTATGAYTFFNSASDATFPNPYTPLGPWLDTVQTVNPALPDSTVLTAQPDTELVVRNQHDVRGSIRVEQVLYSPRALPLRQQALRGVDAAEAGVDATRRRVDEAVLSLYFDALRWRRVVDAAERNVALVEVHVERAQRALELEVGSAFEVNRADVDLLRARRELEGARTAYALTREALAGLLDRDADFDVVEPDAYPLDADPETLLGDALSRRSDLRAARLQRDVQDARIAESRDRWIPSVQAQLQADVQRETDLSGDAVQWFARIAAEWEIYDSGLRRTERRIREHDRAEVELRIADLEDQIRTELAMATLQLEDARREVEQTRQEADLARRNETLTEEARTAGVASYLDVRAAQEQRYLAEIAEATAEVALRRAEYALARVVER